MILVLIALLAGGTASALVLARYYRAPLTVRRITEHALMAVALFLVSVYGLGNPLTAPLCRLCLVAVPALLALLLVVVWAERHMI